MALFGAPVVHEDDPERAVRAALAIVEAVAELRESNPALDLHVRLGVNTGEALIALDADPLRGEGMASGDVVNTAARLESAAPTDGVLVGEATYRATGRVIRYEAAPPVQAKGKTEPVPAWQALEARSRFGVDVDQGSRSAMVGRDRELDALRGAAERSFEFREVQLVTIVGVPGIGKSRLVWELQRWVDARPELIRWRQGRCLPYGEGVTYWALGEVLKAQAGVLESDSAAEAGEKLDAMISGATSDPAEAAWLRRHTGGLVGADAGGGAATTRDEAFAAWRRVLEALAGQGPMVIVLEDLHWADDAMLDFTDHLVEWAADVPLLVVCTARPELLERRRDWGGGKPNATTIALRPLSDDDTAQLGQRPAGAGRAAGRDAGRAARAGGGKPAVRRGVRAHAGRAGRLRGRASCPEHGAGHHRRPPGRAARRREAAAAGRRRARQGGVAERLWRRSPAPTAGRSTSGCTG